MGIVTDPGYSLSGNSCVHGWPTGYTPKKLYVGVFNIVGPIGGGPGALPACNGIYLLEQTVVPCVWEWIGTSLWARFEISSTQSIFSCGQDYPDGKHFFKVLSGNKRWFQNGYTVVGIWRGGYAWVSPRPDYGDFPSIAGVAELAGVNRGKKTFGEIFPKSDGNCVYKFNRKSDKSNLKVLIAPADY